MNLSLMHSETRLKGFPICWGIALGKSFFFQISEDLVPEFTISPNDLEKEIERYRRAIECCKRDIKKLQIQLEQDQALAGVAILDAQLQMLIDPLLTDTVEEEIRLVGKNAEFVFQKIVEQYQKKFDSLSASFFRERFKDLQDLSKRLLAYLLQNSRVSLTKIPLNSIVFANELTATDIAEANVKNVAAFICKNGSPTSHAAIIAKAKGIPFVSCEFEFIEHLGDTLVIVDARTGDIILNPSSGTIEQYERLQEQFFLQSSSLEKVKSLESETFDGYKIRLSANVEIASELETFHQCEGSRIGLFRTEHYFLTHNHFPSEQEQFEVYREIVEKAHGLPIVIRTFDIGGDKFFIKQPPERENNPFLGCRAIRFLLKEKEIFKAQLRAILRCSIQGEVSILFPMVSNLSELLEAKRLIQEACNELAERGEVFNSQIKVGCMIEVPSAAIIADHLARECDFFSIGTNDLVQYTLAVDRGNHSLRDLYTPTHPSILRLIKFVVNEANFHGIPVSVCGEIAADPRFTSLLLGLGLHELSVAVRHIPLIKNTIRNTSILDAYELAEKALSLGSAEEVQRLLESGYWIE